MKRVLLIAYHFPPLAGSSGIQRTLRLVQQLPAHGWHPLVLSAHPMAYERRSDDLLNEVPKDTVVRRAFALDAQRHLSLFGRYLLATATPDRWASWRLDAVRQGMELIRQFRPQAIWSTYPLATAHRIAWILSSRSGLPWIADFRDPMLQADYPNEAALRTSFQSIESATLSSATLCTFTTRSAVSEYQNRYPRRADRIRLLENGYDESSFSRCMPQQLPVHGDRPAWLHSGLVYPSERDPTQLFVALRRLHDACQVTPSQLVLRFRAPVHNDLILSLAQQHGVEPYIEICPPVPYVQALNEMLTANTLLVLQATSCNRQVPAKLYEYLRAGRPIVGLTDAAGDTADVLHRAGVSQTADLSSAEQIANLILQRLHSDEGFLPTPSAVASASREHRTAQLALWLDELPMVGG
jgi:Glycosyl transferase 4-like domain